VGDVIRFPRNDDPLVVARLMLERSRALLAERFPDAPRTAFENAALQDEERS